MVSTLIFATGCLWAAIQGQMLPTYQNDFIGKFTSFGAFLISKALNSFYI